MNQLECQHNEKYIDLYIEKATLIQFNAVKYATFNIQISNL